VLVIRLSGEFCDGLRFDRRVDIFITSVVPRFRMTHSTVVAWMCVLPSEEVTKRLLCECDSSETATRKIFPG
jgi:hypothetical protein